MSDEQQVGSKPTHSTEAYSVLSHPLRRQILLELARYPDPVRLDSLAETIAREAAPDADGPSHGTPSAGAIAASLHHQHIPKLVDVGWIEYDSEDGTIRYQARTEQIQAELGEAADHLASLRAAYDA